MGPCASEHQKKSARAVTPGGPENGSRSENCNSGDQRMAAGCILTRKPEAKMEIPVKYVRCPAGRPRNATSFAFFSRRITISLRRSGKRASQKDTADCIGSVPWRQGNEKAKALDRPRCVSVLVVGLTRLYRCCHEHEFSGHDRRVHPLRGGRRGRSCD